MKCTTPYFAGLADCQKLMKRVVGIALDIKGTTRTKTNFIVESVWNVDIASVTTASRNTGVFPFSNYERTTDDPTINTTNLGFKDKDFDPAPSLQGWLDMSYCDYKTLHSLEGNAFEAVLFLEDGTMYASEKSDGTIKGFRCKISTRKDLPPSDNNQASYPVEIFFRSAKEFENGYIDTPDFTFDDILDMVPAGLAVSITTAMTAGDVVLQVNKRCTSTGVTGLIAADFEVLESNATPTVAVTAIVDNGLGSYTVTVQKDNDGTPANFASGDWCLLQLSDEDSGPTYLTYLSPAIKVTQA